MFTLFHSNYRTRNIVYDFDVGREPCDVVQGGGGEPAGGQVLAELDSAVGNAAEVAVHGEVECGVVVLDGAEAAAYVNADAELFRYLAVQRRLGTLARFDFPAWEFPHPLEFAVSALGGENLPVPMYDGRYDFDSFHFLVDWKFAANLVKLQ